MGESHYLITDLTATGRMSKNSSVPHRGVAPITLRGKVNRHLRKCKVDDAPSPERFCSGTQFSE